MLPFRHFVESVRAIHLHVISVNKRLSMFMRVVILEKSFVELGKV